MKKTLKDLETMKNKSMIPFGSQYEFLFATLEDYYIGKLDGIARIKAELSNWDIKAQKVIVNKLIDIISGSGIIDFDKNEILALIDGGIIQEVKNGTVISKSMKIRKGNYVQDYGIKLQIKKYLLLE